MQINQSRQIGTQFWGVVLHDDGWIG
uniref:Uncharacterized protein n=1 Tax=Musa acuminata subsp. malaccensis TaxID=214687 RepID=A0A804INE2_MUSAM